MNTGPHNQTRPGGGNGANNGAGVTDPPFPEDEDDEEDELPRLTRGVRRTKVHESDDEADEAPPASNTRGRDQYENDLYKGVWDTKPKGVKKAKGEGVPTHFSCKICSKGGKRNRRDGTGNKGKGQGKQPANSGSSDPLTGVWNGLGRHFERGHKEEWEAFKGKKVSEYKCPVPGCTIKHSDWNHIHTDHLAKTHAREHPGHPRAHSTDPKYVKRKNVGAKKTIVKDETKSLNDVKRRVVALEDELRAQDPRYQSVHGLDLTDIPELADGDKRAWDHNTVVDLRRQAAAQGRRRFTGQELGSFWQVADDLEAGLRPNDKLALALRHDFGPVQPYTDYHTSNPQTGEMVLLPLGKQSASVGARAAPPGMRRTEGGRAVPISPAQKHKRGGEGGSIAGPGPATKKHRQGGEDQSADDDEIQMEGEGEGEDVEMEDVEEESEEFEE